MKVVYIAGQYRAETINKLYENIQTARKYAFKYWHKGYVVICPHLNTMFMDGNDTDNIFLKGDHELLKRSDILVLMPNWGKSKGAVEEYKIAKDRKMKIIYEK